MSPSTSTRPWCTVWNTNSSVAQVFMMVAVTAARPIAGVVVGE
jgi:hypothetical protein